jgi:ribonuclease HII
MNILKASLMAMRKAVMDLKLAPDFALVDGVYPIPKIEQPQFAIVGGDRHCRCVGAASIVAKVTRDRIMDRYQALYPSFSFSRHKGYPTPAHLEELREHGPCEIHRKSFKPVADLLKEYALL